jgi:very-short-patch-repair endonuclease
MGRFIVDFLCEPRRLVVEVDGGSHSESQAADAERTQWILARGYRVLRFWNHDVMGNIEGVIAEIERALEG